MTALAQPVVTADTSALASTTVTASYATQPTPGNLMVAVLLVGNSVPSAFPWGIPAAASSIIAGVARCYACAKVAGMTEPLAVSATMGGSLTNHKLAIYEVAPSANREWAGLDQSAGQVDTGVNIATLSTGTTPPTTFADGFAVAGWSMSGTTGAQVSITNGFTSINQLSGFPAHKILTATGPQESTLTWTTARRAAAVVAAFKQRVPVPSSAFLSLL